MFEQVFLNKDSDFCIKKYSQDPSINEYFNYYLNLSDKTSDTKFILGSLYNFGLGVEKDYEKVEFWYLKAAEQNHIIAQINLGYFYEKVKIDYEKAEFWYLKAAEQNNASSQGNLGYLYETIKKDYEKALFWYDKAGKNKRVVRLKKIIQQNKKIMNVSIKDDDECCICKDTFLNNNKSILIIQCSHSFHYDCLKQWKMKCPLCFIDVQ